MTRMLIDTRSYLVYESQFVVDGPVCKKTSDLLLETQLKVDNTGLYLVDFKEQTSFVTTIYNCICVSIVYNCLCTCVYRCMFRC